MIDRLNTTLAGRYVVERQIGAGGMATVYLATDERHNRSVAIKVLAASLTSSVGFARFQREIQIAARLQHPHILGLFDSGIVDDTMFYVMPFIDGTSLRERIATGRPFTIAEAVSLLANIADGLAHAHQNGVVHRDIKPENVMLSGRHALLVDFGVAKALTEAFGDQPLTTLGFTLGTPMYMAPEQVAADAAIDHRADIYAVGVLAYEVLCGRTPFAGLSPQQVIRAHLTLDPPSLRQQRPDVPPALESIVMRCLAKNPDERFQTADELYAALATFGTQSMESVTTTSAEPRPHSRRRAVVATALGVGALAALTGWFALRSPSPALAIGRSMQLTADDGLEIQPSISPNGALVAYAAGNSQRMRIFLRPVTGGAPRALSDDSLSVETQPRWSPDGGQLLFMARNDAYVAPSIGGSERKVVDGTAASPIQSAAWSPDGSEVVVVRNDSLLVFPIAAGNPRLVGKGMAIHSCEWSPTRKFIACISGNPQYLLPGFEFGNLAPSDVVVFPADGGAPVKVTEGKQAYQSPVWASDGRHLYVVSNRDGPRDVYAIGIGRDGHAQGAPQRLTTGLNAQSISLAGDRRHLAYAVYRAKANIWSVPMSTASMTTVADATPVTSGSQVIELMSVSRDGAWLVYDSDVQGTSDIYRLPLAGGSPQLLVHDSLGKFAGELSPDGTEVVYHAFGADGRRRLFIRNIATNAVANIPASDLQETTPHWSPDGSSIVAWNRQSPQGGVFTVHRDAARTWQRARQLTSWGAVPVWSPDGKTIAFIGRPNGSIELISADSGAIRTAYVRSTSVSDPIVESVKWSANPGVLYAKGHDGAGRGGIWSVTVAGATTLLVRLDDPAHPSDRPDFSMSATKFFFTVDDRQSDIWVADVRTP